MGLGKKLKKAAKSVTKITSKATPKPLRKIVSNFDITTPHGRANMLAGGIAGAFNPAGKYKKWLGIDKSDPSTEASDTYAELIRTQWEDFEKKDMNYIRDYANRIVSGQDITDSLNQATEGVNRGFDLSQNTQLRQQAGLGLGLSEAQRLDQAADQKRNRTASLVDAQNAAYTAAKDRQDALLAGAHMPKTQVER